MVNKLNIAKHVTLWVGLTMMVCSCSTQKAKWGNIQFHNTTTHYNIWWNGNESLKQGVQKLDDKVKDDYTRILPVYKLGTKEESMSFNPQFDRAIEKSIKGIKKHSIFVDGREHVPYISQCYMMMAYATFYKQDYTNTASTCQMLVQQYNGTDIGDEASILLARCATQDERPQDAEDMLDELVDNLGKGNFSSKQKLNLYLAEAECTLPQEKYKKAVTFLKLALDAHPTQQQKARISFILGQIYQDQDKRPTASKYYEKVLSCGPSYEMEFNARLNLASCADLQHTDVAKLEKLLDKMLKDRKNEEFLDQIYYAKGEMYVGLRDLKNACTAFKTSSAVSKTNPAQKARSCVRLASILYDKFQDYDQSQIYYDTAMSIIKPDFPHYANIKSRYDILTSLCSFTRVIENNDSVIVLANMPQDKREAIINKKIEDLKKAEEEAKEKELIAQFTNDNKAQQNTLQGDWYFYNSNTVQAGKEGFKRNWGMRALEDYWFLSKKGMMGMGMIAQNTTVEENDTTSAKEGEVKDSTATAVKNPQGDPTDPHSVAYYTKNLPFTSAQQDSLQVETATALLNAGYIYYDGIHNIPKALECYLRMVDKYTDHPDIVQAFYMLYKIYDKQGNTPNANYYKNMVLLGFPDSDFANMILDEDYYKEIIHRNQLIKDDYNEVYTLYRKHKYEDVIRSVDLAQTRYEGNPMIGKFNYWKGLAYAKLDNKVAAIATFDSIIAQYPSTDTIVPFAQMQLDYLKGEGGQYVLNSGADGKDDTLSADNNKKKILKKNLFDQLNSKAEDELPPEALMFRYKENMAHQVIILVKDKKIRATQLQGKVGNFILTYYSNAGLQVKPLMFTDSTQMLTISLFKDASEALDFCHHLQLDEGPMGEYNPEDYQIFAISQQNYTTFYNRKKVDAYQLFYNKYYRK